MNNLPGGWRQFSLREITVERNNRVGALRQIPVLSSTKYHGLVPSDEYFKGRKIYSEDISDYKVVHANWFAYATNHLAEGSIGLQASFDVACVSPIYTVFSCTEEVLPQYLFRVLKSPELVSAYGVHEQASVDRRGAVRYRDFGRIKVNLPLREEQERIIEILDALDFRIHQAKKATDKSRTLSTSLAASLIPVQPNASLPSTDWELIPLAEVVPSAEYGISTSLSIEEGGVPTLRMNNLASGRIKLHEVKYANEPVPRHLHLRDRDVLFNRTNSFDQVGRTSIWRNELPEATFASYLVRLNVNRKRILPEYLVRWLNHPAIQQRIRRLATPGVHQVNINPTNLRRTCIELPTDMAQQQKIVNALEECENLSDGLDAELKKLLQLKQGLTEDLLAGRVRVSDAESVVTRL
ncbi:restriction endonuclease subunit S [Streptomyces sp. SudanB25_2051]|uniref:restriction endonuclease subunit S n=1 Tax=Streptomyces sp. SudanB25_2051 TaxID=3035275 RepID=UPI003F57BF20